MNSTPGRNHWTTPKPGAGRSRSGRGRWRRRLLLPVEGLALASVLFAVAAITMFDRMLTVLSGEGDEA